MEEFLKETRQGFVGRELRKISDELLRADVIGVGEDLHGEACSWKWRYAVIDYLLKNGFDVTVLCENDDGNLQNANGMRLQELDGKANSFDVWQNQRGQYKQFYPFMIPVANLTQWHFDMTRAFSAFPEKRVRFFGADSIFTGPWKHAIAKAYAFDRKHPDAEYVTDDGEVYYNQVGARARNYYNGKLVVDFALSEARRSTHGNRKRKFIYFAHNGHVGKAKIGYINPVNGKREFTRSDGHVIQSGLRPHGLAYLAIGTSALKLQALQKDDGVIQYSSKRRYIRRARHPMSSVYPRGRSASTEGFLVPGGKGLWECDYYFLEKQSTFPLAPITLDATLPPASA